MERLKITISRQEPYQFTSYDKTSEETRYREVEVYSRTVFIDEEAKGKASGLVNAVSSVANDWSV